MKRPVLSHLGTGLMALILAVILWGFAYIRNAENIRVMCRVTLVPPAGYQVSPQTEDIELVVDGPRRLVEVFRANPPSISKTVDRADIEQTRSVFITAEDVPADKRLRLDNLPYRIYPVALSETGTMMLPVRFKTSGTPPAGYVFSPERSYVVPTIVNVTGPKELLLEKDAAVYTSVVEFAANWPASQGAPIPWPARIRPEINGRSVTVDPADVTVYVAFEQQTGSRTFADVLVSLKVSPGYAYKASLNRTLAKITVEGPQQKIGTLLQSDIIVYVDVKDSDTPRELSYVRNVTVLVPQDLKAKADPETVELTVVADIPAGS